MISERAKQYAADWFTIAPKHRTAEKLAEHIQKAIDEDAKDFAKQMASMYRGES